MVWAVGLGAKVESGKVRENLDFILRARGRYGSILRGESLAQICVLERGLGFREESGLEGYVGSWETSVGLWSNREMVGRRGLIQDTSRWQAEQALPIDHERGGEAQGNDYCCVSDPRNQADRQPVRKGSPVSTLGPLDRRVGHIWGLGDGGNMWDLRVSAPTGRTRPYSLSRQRMGLDG